MTSAADTRQWAFDPVAQPELYANVRRRRVMAFFMDLIAIFIIWLIASTIVFFLGIVTLSLAWALYAILWQAVALIYVGATLGGPRSATPGMAAMGVTMRMWHGGRPDGLVAVLHGLAFYGSFYLLTPLIVLVSLFSSHKRLLHDIVLGVVVINEPGRAMVARPEF